MTDLGTILGIIALILAVPLGIAANLVTPTLKNWWATRSQKKLLARVESLELDLQLYSLQKGSWYTNHLLEDIVRTLVWVGYGFYAYLVTVFIKDITPSYPWGRYLYLIIAAILTLIGTSHANYARLLVKRTGNKEYLAKLQRQIDSLKSKLDKPVDNSQISNKTGS